MLNSWCVVALPYAGTRTIRQDSQQVGGELTELEERCRWHSPSYRCRAGQSGTSDRPSPLFRGQKTRVHVRVLVVIQFSCSPSLSLSYLWWQTCRRICDHGSVGVACQGPRKHNWAQSGRTSGSGRRIRRCGAPATSCLPPLSTSRGEEKRALKRHVKAVENFNPHCRSNYTGLYLLSTSQDFYPAC